MKEQWSKEHNVFEVHEKENNNESEKFQADIFTIALLNQLLSPVSKLILILWFLKPTVSKKRNLHKSCFLENHRYMKSDETYIVGYFKWNIFKHVTNFLGSTIASLPRDRCGWRLFDVVARLHIRRWAIVWTFLTPNRIEIRNLLYYISPIMIYLILTFLHRFCKENANIFIPSILCWLELITNTTSTTLNKPWCLYHIFQFFARL